MRQNPLNSAGIQRGLAMGETTGGIHAMFVILGEPENYNLPPAPEIPTIYQKSAWASAFISAAILFVIACIAFAIG